jgi:diguanylate cyclase (GGDEF)-like protein
MMVEETKILVVDDDLDDIYLFEEAIRENSENVYIVETAQSGLEAMGFLAKSQYDAIFCDYRLGDITGIEFIRSVRAAGLDTPIVLLTGVGDTEIDKNAMDAGASDYIPKTRIDHETLDRAIRYAIANTARQRLLQSVLDNTDAGVALVDDNGYPTIWNTAFAKIADCHFAEPGIGAIRELAQYVTEADAGDLKLGDQILESKISTLPNGDHVLFLHDVSERVKAMEERVEADRRIAFLAHHDCLTGLPNRAAFTDRFFAEIRKAEMFRSGFYVLNLDLNRFKEVNDVFGHAVGDGLLVEIAARLKDCLRNDEFLARLGGDEFVAIQAMKETETEIPDLARRFLNVVDGPIEIDGNQVRTGISIGVAIFPDHGSDPEQVLANADAAMYRAKANPLQSVSVFDESLDQSIRNRRALASELKQAVAEDGLEVFFQPQATVKNREIIGFEALARWPHRERGWVPPDTFIPIAEENGLIIPMGDWILRRSCEIAASWNVPHSVAVNVSAIQVGHTDLASQIKSVLEDTGLQPERLEIEITESLLLDDPNLAAQVLGQLKDLGVSIAMDDFGTGYSSLSSLLSFPFDKIKIDRSFIKNIDSSPQAAEIIRAILGLGKNLNFKIIAEGVETEDHVEFLLSEGCDKMQGYLIGKPTCADEIWPNTQNQNDYSAVISARPQMAVTA